MFSIERAEPTEVVFFFKKNRILLSSVAGYLISIVSLMHAYLDTLGLSLVSEPVTHTCARGTLSTLGILGQMSMTMLWTGTVCLSIWTPLGCTRRERGYGGERGVSEYSE
jgi:hypothetical protein